MSKQVGAATRISPGHLAHREDSMSVSPTRVRQAHLGPSFVPLGAGRAHLGSSGEVSGDPEEPFAGISSSALNRSLSAQRFAAAVDKEHNGSDAARTARGTRKGGSRMDGRPASGKGMNSTCKSDVSTTSYVPEPPFALSPSEGRSIPGKGRPRSPLGTSSHLGDTTSSFEMSARFDGGAGGGGHPNSAEAGKSSPGVESSASQFRDNMLQAMSSKAAGASSRLAAQNRTASSYEFHDEPKQASQGNPQSPFTQRVEALKGSEVKEMLDKSMDFTSAPAPSRPQRRMRAVSVDDDAFSSYAGHYDKELMSSDHRRGVAKGLKPASNDVLLAHGGDPAPDRPGRAGGEFKLHNSEYVSRLATRTSPTNLRYDHNSQRAMRETGDTAFSSPLGMGNRSQSVPPERERWDPLVNNRDHENLSRLASETRRRIEESSGAVQGAVAGKSSFDVAHRRDRQTLLKARGSPIASEVPQSARSMVGWDSSRMQSCISSVNGQAERNQRMANDRAFADMCTVTEQTKEHNRQQVASIRAKNARTGRGDTAGLLCWE